MGIGCLGLGSGQDASLEQMLQQTDSLLQQVLQQGATQQPAQTQNQGQSGFGGILQGIESILPAVAPILMSLI